MFAIAETYQEYYLPFRNHQANDSSLQNQSMMHVEMDEV